MLVFFVKHISCNAMDQIVIIFYFSKNQKTTNSTKPEYTILHGLDLLGWGIDMRIGKPFEALQQRYYDFTFENRQSYFYPLNPNLTFSGIILSLTFSLF